MASAGRRLGSFADPVSRMRTWTILSLPQGAGVPTLKERAAAWGVPSRMLLPLQRDGADLGRIQLYESFSLLDHLEQADAEHRAVLATYRHPIWRHLSHWSVPEARHWPAPFTSAEHWLDHQMQRHGVLRLDPDDEAYSIALGLRERTPAPWEDPPPLQVKRFISLDGLLTLLLLHRQAWEALESESGATLGGTLWQAAHQWQERCGFEGEALDTWRWLMHARLSAWQPDAPGHKALAKAEQELHTQHQRDDEVPLIVGKRKARRWRRSVSMRARLSQFERISVSERPCVLFDPAWEWIARNRDGIDAQLAWATDALMADVPFSLPSPAPLVMPASLIQRRQRPAPSYEEWMMFGNTLPYDIIPVHAAPEPLRFGITLALTGNAARIARLEKNEQSPR